MIALLCGFFFGFLSGICARVFLAFGRFDGLAKAFYGKLVEQDAGDEDKSMLLEKINKAVQARQ